MREAPDVILIGEIRDSATMEAAIAFAETGHICLATLHPTTPTRPSSASSTSSRGRVQERADEPGAEPEGGGVARLVVGVDGRRLPATEVLINTPMIRDLLRRGQVHEVKTAMEESLQEGMQSFDQCLFRLYKEGRIDMEEALKAADSRDGLALKFRLSEGATGEHDPYAGRVRRPSDRSPTRAAVTSGVGASGWRSGRAASNAGSDRRPRCATGSDTRVDAEAAGVVDLRHQAAIGKARRVALAIRARRRMAGQHRLGRVETADDPVHHPFVALGLRHRPLVSRYRSTRRLLSGWMSQATSRDEGAHLRTRTRAVPGSSER